MTATRVMASLSPVRADFSAFRQGVLQRLDIGEEEFRLDRFHIRNRVDFASHVRDVRIVKTADKPEE